MPALSMLYAPPFWGIAIVALCFAGLVAWLSTIQLIKPSGLFGTGIYLFTCAFLPRLFGQAVDTGVYGSSVVIGSFFIISHHSVIEHAHVALTLRRTLILYASSLLFAYLGLELGAFLWYIRETGDPNAFRYGGFVEGLTVGFVFITWLSLWRVRQGNLRNKNAWHNNEHQSQS